jgi:hypothetical protein
VIIVFPTFSAIGISGIWGLRPQTPAGKGRKALPRPIPTHFLPFTNGKNNDLKSLQKPTRVRGEERVTERFAVLLFDREGQAKAEKG